MFTLNCKGRLLCLDNPIAMGIINVTSDSFYAGSRVLEPDSILRYAEKMLKDGAVIVDVGGQSTRPGSNLLSADEEAFRVVPAIELIHRNFPELILSIDSFHSSVVKLAVAAGASMVNDVSGGNLDTNMLVTVGQLSVPYVCMHMKGSPKTMQQNTVYDDVVMAVLDFFIRQTAACRNVGIRDIIIDPGFGFGKTIVQNFQLLKKMDVFKQLGSPILMGVSRKSTIYKTIGVTPEYALNGTTAVNMLALLNGALILRVHDVKEAIEAIMLFQEYQKA